MQRGWTSEALRMMRWRPVEKHSRIAKHSDTFGMIMMMMMMMMMVNADISWFDECFRIYSPQD